MIVGNWMKHDPVTVTGDMLVSEARRLLEEHGVRALPVVDARGRPRGLLTRANLLRLEHFVLRTQSQDELDFFVNRLRVRDVMVRNPGTVRVDDTMEHCLRKGRDLRVAQLLVMDGERVVGTISAAEIFELAAHTVGAWEKRHGLTLAPMRLEPGVLGQVIDIVTAEGAVLHAVYPMGAHQDDDGGGGGLSTVVLRFRSCDLGRVAAALEAAGFPVVARSEAHARELAA